MQFVSLEKHLQQNGSRDGVARDLTSCHIGQWNFRKKNQTTCVILCTIRNKRTCKALSGSCTTTGMEIFDISLPMFLERMLHSDNPPTSGMVAGSTERGWNILKPSSPRVSLEVVPAIRHKSSKRGSDFATSFMQVLSLEVLENSAFAVVFTVTAVKSFGEWSTMIVAINRVMWQLYMSESQVIIKAMCPLWKLC